MGKDEKSFNTCSCVPRTKKELAVNEVAGASVMESNKENVTSMIDQRPFNNPIYLISFFKSTKKENF